MRKLVISSLMLLGFAGSVFGQYRIVKLNSTQIKGQEPKADSITVVWDDAEGRRRFTSIFPQAPVQSQGPVRFFTEDGPSNRPDAQGPVVIIDTPYKDRSVSYLAQWRESTETGEAVLGYQTILITGRSVPDDAHSMIYYSRELGEALKIVTTRGDMVGTSEAVSIDQKADFDPRGADLRAVEKAAANAEAAGQGDYARQIRRLVMRWQQAAANWP